MTNYQSGVKLEYEVRDYFKVLGYEVVRAAGSKGMVDLVVWNDKKAFIVQCKKQKVKRSNFQDEGEKLRKVVVPMNMERLMAIKTLRSKRLVRDAPHIVFWNVDNERIWRVILKDIRQGNVVQIEN